jgi:hypothetical protein
MPSPQAPFRFPSPVLNILNDALQGRFDSSATLRSLEEPLQDLLMQVANLEELVKGSQATPEAPNVELDAALYALVQHVARLKQMVKPVAV